MKLSWNLYILFEKNYLGAIICHCNENIFLTKTSEFVKISINFCLMAFIVEFLDEVDELI